MRLNNKDMKERSILIILIYLNEPDISLTPPPLGIQCIVPCPRFVIMVTA